MKRKLLLFLGFACTLKSFLGMCHAGSGEYAAASFLIRKMKLFSQVLQLSVYRYASRISPLKNTLCCE